MTERKKGSQQSNTTTMSMIHMNRVNWMRESTRIRSGAASFSLPDRRRVYHSNMYRSSKISENLRKNKVGNFGKKNLNALCNIGLILLDY